MTMASQMSRHTVYVLEQTVVSGASAGQRRTYSRGRALTCTVFPKPGQRGEQQGQEAFAIPHTLYFYDEHPGVDEQERLQWGDTILVITQPPRDAGGFGRFWVAGAEARREHQGAGTVIE